MRFVCEGSHRAPAAHVYRVRWAILLPNTNESVNVRQVFSQDGCARGGSVAAREEGPDRRGFGGARAVSVALGGCRGGAGGRGPGRRATARSPCGPASWSSPRRAWSSTPARASSRAAASSWRTRWKHSGSTSPDASASTSAPRPAASPTACSSAAPPRVGGGRRRLRPDRAALARGSAGDRDRAPQRPRAGARRPALRARAWRRSTSLSSRLARCCRPWPVAWRRPARCWRWSSRSSSWAASGSASGVVRDAGDRREAILAVAWAARELGLAVRGFASSGLPGPKGNRETFVWCGGDGEAIDDLEAAIAEVEP